MALYIPPRPPIVKAGPVGQGSGVLMTEFPLSTLGNQSTPQQKMRQAWKLGIEVPWIRAAELVIAGKVQSLDWHIEDGDEETVDDDYAGTDAQELRTLIEVGAPWYVVLDKLSEEYRQWLPHFDRAARAVQG